MKRLLNFLCIICLMMTTAARADDPCRNLFDEQAFFGPHTDLYAQNSDGTWRVGSVDYRTWAGTASASPLTLSAGTYTVSSTEPGIKMDWCSESGGTVSGTNTSVFCGGSATLPRTFTINKEYKFAAKFRPDGNVYPGNLGHIQIERGSTATSYAPYNALCATCDGTVREYESATGTVVQDGTPTPTNPINPVFYKQGDMVLRAVGDYADSYDSTTGKITRRVGVKVLDGTEEWILYNGRFVSGTIDSVVKANTTSVFCSHLPQGTNGVKIGSGNGKLEMWPVNMPDITTTGQWKIWLADQYANGTPVIVYYLLATPVTEDWTETSYCTNGIKIATTKYTEDAFAGLITTLESAINKVTNIVDTTVQQATEIGNLATTKQDRPDTDCPAGRKCLLIMGADNKPHWYLIQE